MADDRRLRMAIIGSGKRARDLVLHALLPQGQVTIRGLYDIDPTALAMMQTLLREAGCDEPVEYPDEAALFSDAEVDAVLIASPWEAHMRQAMVSMEAGKITAVEVGGASSVESCFELVRCYERTRTPIMLLENCCYGRTELLLLNMVHQGIFGELVHVEGGYHHDLRLLLCDPKQPDNFRLLAHRLRNADHYPTHELGPLARLLDINRGNRMLTITSHGGPAWGLASYQRRRFGIEPPPYRQSDLVHSFIHCARGETMLLTYDISLPCWYSRSLVVRGTRGIYSEDTASFYIDEESAWPEEGGERSWHPKARPQEELHEHYAHPLWRAYDAEGGDGRAGHGGMDLLMMRDFVRAALDGAPMPIDVYDMATWRVITTLSEQSLAEGSRPVSIPDFTDGRWLSARQQGT